MKDLKYYIKKLYISLDGIDEELKEKIKNLEGYKINECCYCPDPDCGSSCCDCTTCEEPKPSVKIQYNSFGRFNSEEEVIRELDVEPKTTTLRDIHNQFGKFIFVADIEKTYVTPLYFGHKEFAVSGEAVSRENGDMPTCEADPENIEQLYDVATYQNKKIYKAVNDIVSTFDLSCPTVQTKINGEVQVYALKHTGTNGKENSIKSSLEEIAKLLGKLDSRSDVKWSQVLDVAVDNIDDLYIFLVTFVFDMNKVRETIKTEKISIDK